jgi:hypothetical protein
MSRVRGRHAVWLFVAVAVVVLVLIVTRRLGDRRASAQTAADSQQASPLAPVECYRAASGRLDTQAAKQLCTGARSDTPARCFAEIVGPLGMTDYTAVVLCAGAESDAPAGCARTLHATTGLGDQDIAAFCAARQWPVVAPSTAGSPECVTDALDRTALGDLDAVRLCRGATSNGPVACYQQARTDTALNDHDAVELCATVVPWLAPFG